MLCRFDLVQLALARSIVFCTITFFGIFAYTCAYAEGMPDQPDQIVTVSVRAIHATRQGVSSDDTKDINNNAAKTQVSLKERHIHDEGIKDIRGKLKKLQYDNFDLISHQKKSVAIDQKETFTLIDGNVLTFKTISKNNNKVCLWLNWKDGKGANVLDTRLHFTGGETVLTGSSSSSNTGLILAIDVH